QMLETGDWITPRTAEGAPRFQKPIVTYWVVAACFDLLGVSFLTARIAFLVVGAAVIVLTHRLARRLFRNELAAVVAAAFMAGNNQLMYAAMRSMPDVLLCLAMTASLLGFAGVLFAGEPGGVTTPERRRRLALAYVAAGFAVAVKGLLGLVVVLYVLLFVVVGRKSLRSVWAPVPIAVGAAIAGFWFILIARRHGDEALGGFLVDQVASRIPSAGEVAGVVVANAASYLLTPFRDFFPWPELALVLGFVARRPLREFWRQHRSAVLFVLGWLLLLGVMFSGANSSRPRYLLPAWPLLAALLAAIIVRLGSAPTAARLLGRLIPFLMPIGLAGGAVLVAATPGMDSRMIWAACIWIAATIVLKACARRRSLAAGLVAVSLFMLMVFAVYEG
ncbi:MAG TPA: glycosyltransferase family 39 protein, partial [Candidatus Udaeobacter sp.]|nr:glycosyltransferase family 39 protein [Candidatus Udaeobacter sp.]